MDSRQIRSEFLNYFKSKNHTIVDSASLIPDTDPTLLFTNAGMVQFKNAFASKENRGYTRAVSCQRCLRAGGKHNDLDNVGYTARHHTFFEMLGNFSFGDYFKEEAILFAWEFLTEVINLPPEKLWVTVHDTDDEAESIWINEVGFDPARITRLGDEDNFWTMGDTGPCGPSSEIFYDHGPEIPGGPPGSAESELDRYVEIWNLVFTQYNRLEDGTLEVLPMQCVDTGMGLERLAAIKQGVSDNYGIDLFRRLIAETGKILKTNDLKNPSLKVIADHIRSTTFLIADGVLPSNEGRGYVLRRIIRRALRHGHKLRNRDLFFSALVEKVVLEMGEAYPFISESKEQIEKIILKEEEQFQLTLDHGLRILMDEIDVVSDQEISGEVAFKLYDTYGFPVDLTADIAREKNLRVDMKGFEAAMENQRERARAANSFSSTKESSLNLDFDTEFLGYEEVSSEAEVVGLLQNGLPTDEISGEGSFLLILNRTPFYAESGGQIGDIGEIRTDGGIFGVIDTTKIGKSYVHEGVMEEGQIRVGDMVTAKVDSPRREAIKLNHSATHLMHAALRIVLGAHVKQRGSRVSADGLRFDFSHFEALLEKDLIEIERLVNEEIAKNSKIVTQVMSIDEAMKQGALALFDEKYSEEVRVLTMGESFSVELCGGTHAERTGDLRIFQITSEQGTASGVRRIEAVTGLGAIDYVRAQRDLIVKTRSLLKTNEEGIVSKVSSLLKQKDELEKSVNALNKKLVVANSGSVEDTIIDIGKIRLIVSRKDGMEAKMLPSVMDQLKNGLSSGVVVVSTVNDQKVGLIVGVTKDLVSQVDAVDLANHVSLQVGGKGGGRPDMARAGGSDPGGLDAALAGIERFVRDRLNQS